jgi:hypothetical protein
MGRLRSRPILFGQHFILWRLHRIGVLSHSA